MSILTMVILSWTLKSSGTEMELMFQSMMEWTLYHILPPPEERFGITL